MISLLRYQTFHIPVDVLRVIWSSWSKIVLKEQQAISASISVCLSYLNRESRWVGMKSVFTFPAWNSGWSQRLIMKGMFVVSPAIFWPWIENEFKDLTVETTFKPQLVSSRHFGLGFVGFWLWSRPKTVCVKSNEAWELIWFITHFNTHIVKKKTRN